MVHYKKFHWLHHPSGRDGVTEWSDTHFAGAGIREDHEKALGMPEPNALKYMNDWNAQQPKTWTYWVLPD